MIPAAVWDEARNGILGELEFAGKLLIFVFLFLSVALI